MTARRNRRTPKRSIGNVPPWIQAITAIAGVLLTALTVFNLVPKPVPEATSPAAIPTAIPPASPVPASAAVVAPRVTLDRIIAGPAEVDADGAFENVFTQRQTVVLLGQPVDEATDWVPVVADLQTLGTLPNLGDTGRWRANRPGVTGTYQWSAVVIPALSGAGDVLEDLKRNGPSSEHVVSASSTVTTE